MSTAKINLYTDEEIYDVTPYATSYMIQCGLFAPYQNAQISLSIPLHQLSQALPYRNEREAAIDLDAWLVISDYVDHDPPDRTVFLGRLSAVSYGVEARDDGMIASSEVTLAATSFLTPMIESQFDRDWETVRSGGSWST